MDQCFLCQRPAKVEPREQDFFYTVTCSACGKYLGDPVDSDNTVPKYILSGVTRSAWENGVILKLTLDNIGQLGQSASIPDGPLESMDRILLYVAVKLRSSDEFCALASEDYPIAFAKHSEEFDYFLLNLMERRYIESEGLTGNYRLTPDGWERVAELRRNERNSSQAFVAMWFDQTLDSAWNEGFRPALEAAGFSAVRVDKEEYNEKIDDRIIAQIRRSGLLVADVTGHRQGVYFEGGFALGLGITVIWTCREGDIESAHFDTRQYNHIVWTDPEDLRKRLIDRIEATLPSRSRRAFPPVAHATSDLS